MSFKEFWSSVEEDPTWLLIGLVILIIAGIIAFQQFTRLSATLDHQPVYGALTIPKTASSSSSSSVSSRRRRTSSTVSASSVSSRR